MSGTFTQFYIHIVIAVKGRQNLLKKAWRQEVFRYISGIIKGKGHKPIIVNGVGDHVHIFIGIKPVMAISDLVRDIKNNSSKFINERKFVKGKFSWQEGYGGFSNSHSQLDRVYQYIKNQEEHHRKKSFREEYIDFLQKFGVAYQQEYLFDWMESDLEDDFQEDDNFNPEGMP